MKKLILITAILLSDWTSTGTFIVGFAIPQSTSIVGEYNAAGERIKCEVYTGETRECTYYEELFIDKKYGEEIIKH